MTKHSTHKRWRGCCIMCCANRGKWRGNGKWAHPKHSDRKRLAAAEVGPPPEQK